MIFLILGTQKFQLNRLLQEMDEICERGKIKGEIFAQIGHSDYKPKNYSYIDFLDKEKFDEKIGKSSLVITHSGVGSIITALQSKKPVIVYPRLSKYKEHVDDHQLEIAEAFEKKRFVLCCHEGMKIQKLIEESFNYDFKQYVSSTNKILEIIEEFLKENE